MKEIVVNVAFKSKYPTRNYAVMLDENNYARLQFELYKAKICDIGAKLKHSVRLADYPSLNSFMRSINSVIFESVVMFELEYERDKRLLDYTERLYADPRIPDDEIENYRLKFFESPSEIYVEKLFIKDFAMRYGGVTEIVAI